MRLYNTLTRSEEDFAPGTDNTVRMYTCGLTVYARGHIGNFRTFICVDVLRRTLKYLLGYRVKQVMNFTDVDDRTIVGAQQARMDLRSYTDQYIAAFREDARALGLEEVEENPRATDETNLRAMAEIVGALEKQGHAYRSDGSVYFRISTMPQYGHLARLDHGGMKAGARVDSDSYEKEDARDFVLWKATKPGEPAWDFGTGPGRPGWHLECSAMALRLLGPPPIDIHAGGIDLVFPHHENEIAQSEGATGKQFVRHWLHFEHLKVEGETMSKSKGNYFTFRDLTAKGFTPAGIRYFLLSVPCRKQLNFTFDALAGAEKTVASLRDFRARLDEAKTEPGRDDKLQAATEQALTEFEAGMDDDLNTSVALAAVHELTREVNTALARRTLREDNKREVMAAIERLDSVLNVFGQPQREMLDEEIQKLIDERQEARHRRDFERGDEIRDELAERGIVLEDTKDGVRWKRK